MSRTVYVASRPMRTFPLPRTRLLGKACCAAILQFGFSVATGSSHNVPQTPPHRRRPAAFRCARAARTRDDAHRGEGALGGGDEQAAGKTSRTPQTKRPPAGRTSAPPEPAPLRGPADVDSVRLRRHGPSVAQLLLYHRFVPNRTLGR